MKRFLLDLFNFITIIIGMFIFVDFITSSGLKKSKTASYIDWNNIFSGQINSDIIINGSSKAALQISPKIIDNILKVSSYNLGIEGHDFFMQYGKYQAYLAHNSIPKIVIQVVGNSTLDKRDDLYGLHQFLPYLDNTILVKFIDQFIGINLFQKHIPFIRYFGEYKVIANGILSYAGFNIKPSKTYKGFKAVERRWDGEKFDIFIKKYPNGIEYAIDSNSVIIFNEFLGKNLEQGINTILVYSPTYIESQNYIINRKNVIDLYTQLSKKYGILFLDSMYGLKGAVSQCFNAFKVMYSASSGLLTLGTSPFLILFLLKISRILFKLSVSSLPSAAIIKSFLLPNFLSSEDKLEEEIALSFKTKDPSSSINKVCISLSTYSSIVADANCTSYNSFCFCITPAIIKNINNKNIILTKGRRLSSLAINFLCFCNFIFIIFQALVT